jgi:hypothetical protein
LIWIWMKLLGIIIDGWNNWKGWRIIGTKKYFHYSLFMHYIIFRFHMLVIGTKGHHSRSNQSNLRIESANMSYRSRFDSDKVCLVLVCQTSKEDITLIGRLN